MICGPAFDGITYTVTPFACVSSKHEPKTQGLKVGFLSDKIRQPLEKCWLDCSLATHFSLVQFSLHTGLGGYFLLFLVDRKSERVIWYTFCVFLLFVCMAIA